MFYEISTIKNSGKEYIYIQWHNSSHTGLTYFCKLLQKCTSQVTFVKKYTIYCLLSVNIHEMPI